MMAGIAALHPADCTIYSSMQTKAEAVSGACTLLALAFPALLLAHAGFARLAV